MKEKDTLISLLKLEHNKKIYITKMDHKYNKLLLNNMEPKYKNNNNHSRNKLI